MSQQRHVWTANYADVQIYREDTNGNVIDDSNAIVSGFDPNSPSIDPVLSYCYLQNASLNVTAETVRRPVGGRATRKLTIHEFDDCQLSSEWMFFKKSEEHNTTKIFNRAQRLRLVLKLVDITYTGVDPYENDSVQLTRALATQFGIDHRDNEVIVAKATFEAEEML